ncbi:MAG: Uma2 family endonuclease [Gemmataceae bacterium]
MSDQAKAKPGLDPFRYGWREAMRPDENGRWQYTQIPLTLDDVLHPQEDDHFMVGEPHKKDCKLLLNALEAAVGGQPGVHVFFDHRVDWGLPELRPMGPDLVVWHDFPADWDENPTFRPKEHGARPAVLIEVTSPSTRDLDLNKKVKLYHKVGVPLYVIVDYWEEGEERRVSVFGYRATNEGYVRIDADEDERFWVEPVRMWLVGGGPQLVCLDEQGQPYPDYKVALREVKQAAVRAEELEHLTEEAVAARQEAERKAKDAEKRATDLADRIAELEAKLRGETP